MKNPPLIDSLATPHKRFLYMACLLLVFVGVWRPASATTYRIDSSCSLADAITAANTNLASGGCSPGSVSSDRIILTADITLSAELPAITSRIDIEGENYEISGNSSYRIFQVGSNGDLDIEDLTLSNGSTSGDGGAIEVLSGGRLSVDNSIFEDNEAGDDGGAISVDDSPGTVSIDRSIFENNEAGDDGGAIYFNDSITLDIDESRFTNNTSGGVGGAIYTDEFARIIETVFETNSSDADGGAIWIAGLGGDLDVRRSSFVGNSADDEGGAIGMHDTAEGFDIENSTFSNNTADTGSAILIDDQSASTSDLEILLEHVTIVGNSSATLFRHYGSGTVEVENSILYNLGGGDACAGGFDLNVTTIIEDGSCDNPANLSVDPLLGAFTKGYYPVLAGSPAINAGVSRCKRLDQRGLTRPRPCTIGAYEFGSVSSSTRSASRSSLRQQPARVTTTDDKTVAHNQQVMADNNWQVGTQEGLHTISLRSLDPMDCGAIGNDSVCAMDVLDVADISGFAAQGVRFCFPQRGRVLFMPSHAANSAPINQKTAQPETLAVELVNGMTCVTVYRTGKLVLVAGEPLVAQTQQEEAQPQVSEPVWRPAPVTQCGHYTRADGAVVHRVAYGHHCWAIALACGIFPEDIRRLNPEHGDCTMLYEGDELVVSEPPSATDMVDSGDEDLEAQTVTLTVVERAGPVDTPESESEAIVEEIPYDDPEYIAIERRIMVAVARCMRDISPDHTRVTFAMVKREARRFAELAWSRPETDDAIAKLGDGRLTVRRAVSYFYTPEGEDSETEYRVDLSPVCQQMQDQLNWRVTHSIEQSEPEVTEEDFEALRYAIFNMIRMCQIPYAVAEREAEKIARAAVQDGVRSTHELPAYRAMELGHRLTTHFAGSEEFALYAKLSGQLNEEECFALPDDSYLEDWGKHGDKDQLYNEQQIEEAEAAFEAIKEWGVAACDIALTLGGSVVADAGELVAKDIVIDVVKESLTEVAKLAAKKGAAELSRASVDEKASARQKIIADFRSNAIELFPTGPCSLVVGTLEFAQLQVQMEQALAELEAGVDLEALDVFGDDVHCNIYSTNTVIAKRDPDPNRDASELRLDASDTFSPLATVEHNGEKYYVVLGARGSGTQVVGELATAAFYNNPANRGHAFVPLSAVDATDSCQDLPDASDLYPSAAHPQDLVGREIVDLNIQEVPDAFASDNCKFSMDIDEDRLTIIDLPQIQRESSYISFNVFRLCETYEFSSCTTVSEDNAFVITHYDWRNRRVYVKSLDGDGRPEGWLATVNYSARYIPQGFLGIFGFRQIDSGQVWSGPQTWVNPDDFDPGNVIEGSLAYGDPSLCLPSPPSQ